jgi:hypothetical protein
MMNLQLNDPALPAPGEMISESSHSSYQNASPSLLNGSPIVGTGDPHHSRAPSLGEIHQELEQEGVLFKLGQRSTSLHLFRKDHCPSQIRLLQERLQFQLVPPDHHM